MGKSHGTIWFKALPACITSSEYPGAGVSRLIGVSVAPVVAEVGV